jgi:hypothetical protein
MAMLSRDMATGELATRQSHQYVKELMRVYMNGRKNFVSGKQKMQFFAKLLNYRKERRKHSLPR